MLDFSIVIPTYNRPAQLAECLAALNQLDYPADCFEIIVVDDGSPQPLDAIVEAARGPVPIRLLRQDNRGPGVARNCGVEAARGQFIAFTDDDCCPRPAWLRELAQVLAQHPEALVGGQTINRLTANPYATASQMITTIVYRRYNPDPACATFFASNNMALTRAAFEAVGGFDVRMSRLSEDRDLCDRWRFQGRSLRYVETAIIDHAHHMTLRSYLRQHYRYGRGAYYFHRQRAARGSGTLVREARFHANLDNWLLRPLREAEGWRHKLSLFVLIGLWQVANTVGYFSAMLQLDAEAARPSA